MADFDLAIVGGGINGAGIARDAAGRGLRVLLLEQNDLASGTSSASTKLIHGGLRYLEHGWLRLTREGLAEREVMLRMAPHLVRPMRFVLPAEAGLRPAWMLRAGLFVYDHLGARQILAPTRSIDLARDPLGAPLRRRHGRGFEYSDCVADDSRLVVLNTLDAAERGAVICTRTRAMRAERGAVWQLVLDARGRRDRATARVLVNATGPWTKLFADQVLDSHVPVPVRLDKGSHIVVRRLFEHDGGYVLQASDGRVVFALPFEHDFTLIGTTDQSFVGDPAAASASAEEIGYLCRLANRHFCTTIGPADVAWSFAGVRSLYDDGAGKAQDVSRDYVLMVDGSEGRAPLLTVYGGKITTYRRLAEHALARLSEMLEIGPAWTRDAPLPGGEFPWDGIEELVAETRRARPFLGDGHARRLVRTYGTRVERVLGPARSLEDLGPWLGADLTGAEVRYLMEREWAQTEEDVLWRRTKLGLRFSPQQREQLAKFMAAAIGGA
ncbi:MAG TPA: glycerol-3-phosphate dehydrogenase [Xanthobacteraceae bacterium]|jgi:glycerol-3-phosphate dehydrogenase